MKKLLFRRFDGSIRALSLALSLFAVCEPANAAFAPRVKLVDTGHAAATLPSYSVYEEAIPATNRVIVRTYAQFKQEVANATPGKVIEVAAQLISDGVDFNITASGTETNPIYLIARGSGPASSTSVTARGFTGRLRLQIFGSHWRIMGLNFYRTAEQTIRIRGSNVKLIQNSFVDCGYASISQSVPNPNGACVYLGATAGGTGQIIELGSVQVRRNIFDSSYLQSISVASPVFNSSTVNSLVAKGAVIEYNTFRNGRARLNASGQRVNGGESIQVGIQRYTSELQPTREGDRLNIMIRYNRFTNQFGDSELISVKSSANIIESNYAQNSRGGISLRYGHENTIQFNVVDRRNIAISDDSAALTVAGWNNQIVENDFYGSNEVNIPSTVVRIGSRVVSGANAGAWEYFPAVQNYLFNNRYYNFLVGTVANSQAASQSGVENHPIDNSFLDRRLNGSNLPGFLAFSSSVPWYDLTIFRETNTVSNAYLP